MGRLKELESKLDALCAEVAPKAVELRRDLHRNPELGWQEYRTQRVLRERLTGFGLHVHEAAGTGLFTDLGEGGEGFVLYRADMDALPIQDAKPEDQTPVRSGTPGIVHACGHDIHMAVGMGIAEVLARLKDELPGRIRFVFQPAEEVVPSGADTLVREGVADGARACLAVHADPMREVGRIGVRSGAMTAASDRFEIKVIGAEGHASRPYLCKDAVLAAARVVEALHGLTTHFVNPLEPSVLAVGSIQGGSAANVLPAEVVLSGSIRTFSEETRLKLSALVRKVSAAAAATLDCKVEVEVEHAAPTLSNDEVLDAIVRSAVEDALGEESLQIIPFPSTGSEDFSYFSQIAPTYMIRLGVRRPGSEAHHLHTGTFNPDEGAVEVGMRVMGRAVLRAVSRV